MIPVQNTKYKIITTISLVGLIIVGLLVWFLNKPKQTSDQIQELTLEEAKANAQTIASSSPDFARRMKINELPDIGNFSNYKKDDNYVYYGTDTVVGADPNTFEIINEEFAKDKIHVYSKGRVLEDSDSNTFVIDPIPHDKSNVYLLLTCENNQWAQCYRKVNGADSATFKIIGHGFGKDKSNVFYHTEIVPEADTTTFTIHDGGKYGYTYGYDKNYIFVAGYDRAGVIKEKCNNFDQIGGYYLKCDDKIYYVDKLLTGADSNTFTPVGVTANYAKDSKIVYFDGEVVAGADAATFDIGDGINARDKDHVYRYGKVIE